MARRPFRSGVDTGSYFPAEGHRAALAAIEAAFARRDAIALIDGPPGVGKSLIARLWLERLPPAIPRIVMPNVLAMRPTDLLQGMLFDLDQPYRGLTEHELRLAVTALVLQVAETGHATAVLIDEAQHLSPAALEELRLLGNIEADGGSAMFALLAAQPEFHATLNHPECAALAHRIGTRCRVAPFSVEESAAYLRQQIQLAGGDPRQVMDDDAVAVIAGACGGVPRILNRVASRAAELAASAEAETVDVEAALEAVSNCGLESSATEAVEPVLLQVKSTKAKPKALRKRSA